VKGVNPDDRPREKLSRAGAASLGDNELLAILVGTGTAGRNALGLANQVLDAVGGLHGLLRTSRDELLRVHGVGDARAAQLLSAIELGRRVLTRQAGERKQIKGPRDVAEQLLPEYGSRPIEQFGALLLDTKHRVLRTTLLSVGSQDGTSVQPREVFRQAVLASATAVVLFHNHPSGDPFPSPDDISLTLRMVAAGELMGIVVVDHVILGDGKYYSVKESGVF
jgi:DNA repair protein RadC